MMIAGRSANACTGRGYMGEKDDRVQGVLCDIGTNVT